VPVRAAASEWNFFIQEGASLLFLGLSCAESNRGKTSDVSWEKKNQLVLSRANPPLVTAGVFFLF